MDETRRGDDAHRDEPHQPQREPEPPAAPEPPPSQIPTSNFPTFGRTPGWEDDPDERATSYSRPYGQPTEPYGQRGHGQDPYGQRPYEQQVYGQPYEQGYDQGYGYPGYTYEQPQPPAAYPGYAYQGYGPTYAPETESGAIISLVLAILSWTVCPLVLAIPALIVASNSHAKIRSFPGRYSGYGLITAARVVAWTNIAACVGVVVLFAALAAAGVQ